MQPVMRTQLLLLLVILLSGCNFPGFNGRTPEADATATIAQPTATPIPLAATVAGESITLEAYESEIARFEAEQARVGIDLATIPEYREQVLWALIDLTLLAQGARAEGYEISPDTLDARIEELKQSIEAPATFETWLSENLYSLDSFRSALYVELLAAEMVTLITDAVPASWEQVQARHILVATLEEAEDLRSQIIDGEDFDEIAKIYSIDASTRPAGGNLGWFPEGYLLWPELNQAVSELQPGELSQVVQSELGYHLVELLAREEHPLDYLARLYVQEEAVLDWLDQQKDMIDIQIFVEK